MAGVMARVKEVPKIAAAVGALIGVVAGVLGLIAWFNPDAKPKPRSPTDAGLQLLDFQTHVTLAHYLRTIPPQKQTYSAATLRHDGVVATLKAVNVSGVKRADLYWTVRDAVSGEDLASDLYFHRLAGHFVIHTTGDSGGQPFWVPSPARSGRYRIRFELDAPNGTILALMKTGTTFVVG